MERVTSSDQTSIKTAGPGNLRLVSASEGLGINFARRKGIEPDDPQALTKLRALPTAEVVDGLTFGVPAHDPPTFNGGGAVEKGKIVAKVGQAYASGAFHHIPMMIGATADDMGGADRLHGRPRSPDVERTRREGAAGLRVPILVTCRPRRR